jgi:hypothetical protein
LWKHCIGVLSYLLLYAPRYYIPSRAPQPESDDQPAK